MDRRFRLEIKAAWIVFGLLLVGVPAGCASRIERPETVLRVMTVNLRDPGSTDGEGDARRLAGILKEARADIVALQEVRRDRDEDILTELSDLTGFAYAFGSSSEHGNVLFGNAFLTRFPILEERNHLYRASRAGTQRGALALVVDVGGIEIAVVNTDLGPEADENEREERARELLEILADLGDRPCIVLGTLHDTPGSRTSVALKKTLRDVWDDCGTGDGWTFPSGSPVQRIDYIFVTREREPAILTPRSAQVLASSPSGHLPVAGELTLPERH